MNRISRFSLSQRAHRRISNKYSRGKDSKKKRQKRLYHNAVWSEQNRCGRLLSSREKRNIYNSVKYRY